MLGIAKIVAIYFINMKCVGGLLAWDPKMLFILVTIFYGALVVICSDFLIQKVFNIQQGLLTIAKALDNWNVKVEEAHLLWILVIMRMWLKMSPFQGGAPSQPDCMYNINKNNLENVKNSNNNFVINRSNYFFGGSVLKIKL